MRLSDFHSTTISDTKTHFRSLSPKIISYNDYTKRFHEKTESVFLLQQRKSCCINVLDEHTPHKKKYVWQQQSFYDQDFA